MAGRFSRIARKVGVGLPAGDRRTAEDALDGLLELSRSEESRARQLACKNLCTCHVRADDDRVWTRLLELAGDPDPLVRGVQTRHAEWRRSRFTGGELTEWPCISHCPD
jgi:hypothetical protein